MITNHDILNPSRSLILNFLQNLVNRGISIIDMRVEKGIIIIDILLDKERKKQTKDSNKFSQKNLNN